MISVLQNPANAWGPAIGNIGNVLGQALGTGLEKYGQQKKQKQEGNLIQQAIDQIGEQGLSYENVLQQLGRLYGQNINPQSLSPLLKVLEPLLNASAKNQAYLDFDKKRQEARNVPASPIDEIKSQKNIPSESPNEQRRVPSQNAPQSDFGNLVPRPTFENQPIDEDLINSYEASPFERDNKIAQRLANSLRDWEKLKGKYTLENAKENRAAVREYSKPYTDVTKLKDTVRKMERVQELISSKKIGRNKNIGSFLNALIEGKGNEAVTTLFKTPPEQELGYLIRDLYNTKDIGGSNPSTKEVLITLSTLPERFKTPEANKKIAEGLLNLAYQNLFKGESVLNNLDKGLPLGQFISETENYASNLNDLRKKVGKNEVLMFSPEGEPWFIKKDQVEKAKKAKFRKVYD